MKVLIKNALIVNEGEIFKGGIFIENGLISEIYRGEEIPYQQGIEVIDADWKTVIPGVIDTHVHFREPGLTHKGDIYTESKAAVAGGVTSYFEMPNTIPNAINQTILEDKNRLASEKSFANYSFYIGATNHNFEELKKVNNSEVCSIKMFLGASTGNMLVDDESTLHKIFSQIKIPLSAHCEDEHIVKTNLEIYRQKYGEDIPAKFHPLIRSTEACYKSTKEAINLAKRYNSRLNVMHVSTQEETELFDGKIPVKEKMITSETCIYYIYFSEKDYERYGNLIKCNPSIKKESDRTALIKAINEDRIDIISTDHAPHTTEEKQNKYIKSPSGIPGVQHSLVAMLELFHKGHFRLEKIVEKMCHNPAISYKVKERGFIRKGYWADLAIIDINAPWTVEKSNILYKCKWSPFEGLTFTSKVTHTFVNGELVFEHGKFNESVRGKKILFEGRA